MFGYGGYQYNPHQNTQQGAANQVRATAGSSPSLGLMQQAMGGNLTNETQQNAFGNFFSGLMQTFAPAFNSLINSGYGGTGMEAPVQDHLTPQEPELSAYEKRIKALMEKRGWTREEAIANQQNALGLNTDYNNDGAVTNDEWDKFKQTPTGAAYHARTTGQKALDPKKPDQPQSLLHLPEKTQNAIANIKKYGGLFL